ncbi:MAG: c-type cytochrome [Nitrospirales bacterium]
MKYLTLIIGLIVGLASIVYASAIMENDVRQGQEIYERSCLMCHGASGEGDGPAAFYNAAYSASRARDFTVGNYKFRSTVSGSLPLDQDLFRTITNGIPGFMPSFGGLSPEQRWQVVAYIKSFYAGFQEETPESIQLLAASPIPSTAESVQRGRALYEAMDCHSCHGPQARGSGKVALAGELKDSRGLPISPNDLTNPTGWKNGTTAQDVVRTLFTGLDGTPMPSYESQLAGHEDDAWHLANYLLSLSGQN